MNDADNIETLIAAWIDAAEQSGETAGSQRRQLHEALTRFSPVILPVEFVDRSLSSDDPQIYIENLTLWPIEEDHSDQQESAGPPIILPLHRKEETTEICQTIGEAYQCATELYHDAVGPVLPRRIDSLAFLIGDLSTDFDQNYGHFSGRSMQASVVVGLLSWFADCKPPSVICFGPCDPSKFRVDNVYGKIRKAVSSNWNNIILPAASLDDELLKSLGDDGWQALTGSIVGQQFINRQLGQKLSIYTYDSPADLFDRWRSQLGLPMEVDLAYRPSLDFDPSTDQPTFGDLWRAALQVGPSPNRIPLPSFKLSQLLRSLSFSSSGMDGWPVTDLEKKVWDYIIKATVESNTNPFDASQHVILAGPTSCGKTSVAELLMVSASLQSRDEQCVIYVAPTKVLAQTVYRKLVENYSQSGLFNDEFNRPIIVSTGEDVADDWRFRTGDFSIACLVYEKANVLASIATELLSKLRMVVADEIHMLTHNERGPLLDTFLAKIQMEHERRSRAVNPGDNLRIVAISTEAANGDANLEKLLTYRSVDTNEEVPPIAITTSVRPVPVTHALILDTKQRSLGSYRKINIKTFQSTDSRILGESELEALDQSIRAAEYETRPTSRNLYKQQISQRQEAHNRLVDLIDDLFIDDPEGRRILVFVSSKRDIYELAGRLKNKITSRGQEDHSSAFRDCFTSLDGEVEDEKALKDLKNWAKAGVIVHHGSLDPEVRPRIEAVLAEPPEGKSEILLATETLSFGVNLWITDVILLGTQFYDSPRDRSDHGDFEPVEIWEFHNMVGRAGRLGKTDADKPARVLILPWIGEDASQTVLRKYYSDVKPIESKIFLRPEKNLVQQAEFEEITAEKFSHPFIRSLLDALRHTAFTEAGRVSDIHEIGIPSSTLFGFYENTLYGRTKGPLRARRSDVNSDNEKNREAELFRDGCELALAACVELSPKSEISRRLGLVSVKSAENEPSEYAITEEGEAIIDTGVEVGTVVPLLQLASNIRELWSKLPHGNRPFPTEIYLLCVIAQREGHGHVIADLPEFQGGGESWAKQYQLMNTRDIRRKLSRTLKRILKRLWTDDPHNLELISTESEAKIEQIAEAFADGLKDVLANQPIVDELRRRKTQKARYDLGAVDSFFRLFNAMAAWIEGESFKVISEHLESVPQGLRLSPRFQRPIRDYSSGLSWKIECLTRLLAVRSPIGGQDFTGDKPVSEQDSDSDDPLSEPMPVNRVSQQIELKNLVWRLRLGCKSAGIPMLIRRDSDITRTDVAKLINGGVTAVNALREQDPFMNMDELSSAVTKSSVRREVQVYAINQFRALAQSLTLGHSLDQTPGEMATANLWGWLSSTGFPVAADQYRRLTRGQNVGQEIWRALAAGTFDDYLRRDRESESKLESSICLVASDDDRRSHAITLSRDAAVSSSISLVESEVRLRESDSAESPHQRVLKIIFVGMRDNWTAQTIYGEWEQLSDILECEEDVENLAIVFVPWTPPMENCPVEAKAALQRRWGDERKRTVLFTLPAFGAFLSILSREFLRSDVCLDHVFEYSTRNMISIPSLLEILEHSPHFPQPLRDAMMRYASIEVRDRLPA